MRKAIAGVREAVQRGATVVCLQGIVQRAVLFVGSKIQPVRVGGTARRANRDQYEGLGRGIEGDNFDRGLRISGAGIVLTIHWWSWGPKGSLEFVSQDAHPARSAVRREVLLYTRRHGLHRGRHTGLCRGTFDLLGSMVSRGARLTALQGAEILFYPTAIGWMPGEESEHENQRNAWETIQRSHAIANGVFTVSVNRVGVERSSQGEIHFWGGSFVCAPTGEILARAGQGEEVLVVECDLSSVAPQSAHLAVLARPPRRCLRWPDPALGAALMVAVTTTPAQAGFRMPAEWEPHAATWLTWPCSQDWPGKLPAVRWTFCEIVRLLTRFEGVNLIVQIRP